MSRFPWPGERLKPGLMADPTRKLVVRSYAPRRRALLLGAAVCLGVVAAYGAFELGRALAGYDVIEATRAAWAASRRIRALERENAKQRAELAAADVARRVDREGEAQLEHNLADLQGQIARLNQSLAFYRGLVQPDSIVKAKVQQMQIVPLPAPRRFRLKFMLMQVGSPTRAVAGRIALSLLGRRGAEESRLSLAQVSRTPRASLRYSFRDFQNFDVTVRLPPGFAPERIGVVLRDGAGREYRQAFLWRTRGMSAEADGAPHGAINGGGLDVQAKAP